MHEAEAEEGIGIGLRQDVRHRVAVAHDLDLLLGPGQGIGMVIIGKRLVGQVVGEGEPGHAQGGEREHRAHQPPKEKRHARRVLFLSP